MTPPDEAMSTREVQLLTTAKLAEIEKKTDSGIRQNAEILGILNEMKLQQALGNKRQDDVEKRLDIIESDKRSVAAMIASGAAVVGALGTLVWDMVSKHVPVFLVFAILALSGCGDDRAPAYPIQPLNDAQLEAIVGPQPATTAEVDARVKVLQEALKILATERRGIIVEARQTKIYWLSGILGFAAVGLGIAAWFSPFFRTTLVLAAAGCGAFATILLYVARWADYFEWIGAGLLVATAATVILLWRNKAHALTVLATHFSSYADKLGALAPEVRAELDRISVDAQTPAVKATIDKALSTVKATL